MNRFFGSIAVVCLLFVTACGPMAQAIGQSMKQCELGQLPSSLQGAVSDVTAALASNDWQSELTNLAIQIGASQLECVVSAVVTNLKGRLPTHGQADPAYLAAIQRGESWLASGKK